MWALASILPLSANFSDFGSCHFHYNTSLYSFFVYFGSSEYSSIFRLVKFITIIYLTTPSLLFILLLKFLWLWNIFFCFCKKYSQRSSFYLSYYLFTFDEVVYHVLILLIPFSACCIPQLRLSTLCFSSFSSNWISSLIFLSNSVQVYWFFFLMTFQII